MTEHELEQFRALLLKRQAELLEVSETGEEGAAVVELDQTRVGRVSRMDAMRAQAMSVEAKRRRGIELQRIEQALSRIDNGEYGYCLACGEPISKPRLLADPANPLCIHCAK